MNCPACSDAEWNQSDDALIAQYGLGCDLCHDTGVVVGCPYCDGPEADYHTACFDVEIQCWRCSHGSLLTAERDESTVTA